MKFRGARVVLEALKNDGVKAIFGFPGGAVMELYDEVLSAVDAGNVRHVLCRHEQGVAHAADGYYRALGEVGVGFSTSGPGGTNLLTGMATAFLDSSACLYVSGQVPTSMMGTDAFQEADMFGLTLNVTKHNYKVTDVQKLPYVMKEALAIAQTGRPGPVFIDLPRDVQQKEVEFDPNMTVNVKANNNSLDTTKIKEAVKMLLQAERPAILAGGGVLMSGAWNELVQLAELLMAPVSTTLVAKGVISEMHPLAMGMAGFHGRRTANFPLINSDVLLAVGCRFSDRVTAWQQSVWSKTQIIHVDIDFAEIEKNLPVDMYILGDAKKVLTEMLNQISNVEMNGKKLEWSNKVKELKEMCDCNLEFEDVPIKPQRVMRELSKVLSNYKRHVVTTEVGQNQIFAGHFLKSTHARSFLTSGGLGTMGFGFPAAIGAKVAMQVSGQPDAPVVDVAGDGSLMMVCQEFATAVENEIPVVIALLNNRWLGMVKQWQKLFFGARYSATNLGQVPDFVKLAEAFGAKGEVVVRPGEIREALERAIKEGVPYVVDIKTDPEEDILPMVPPPKGLNEMIGGRCPPELVERCG